MRITIAAVGRLKNGPERDLFERYWGRISTSGKKLALSPLRMTEISESRASSAETRKAEEARRLLDCTRGDKLVALDETGAPMTSAAFAALLRKERDNGTSGLAFLLGGADGHGTDALTNASIRLSLGMMTLPHGLARVVLAEQLYRASTILSGHPYHRE
jgi:23S rRNA (pseudouridine1915-N3)-methyltransferase